jgi:D-beta-D-heptose 7-phosphate kinase / D-beta-D-heptose 1-phosphate adenosyltransferase
MFNDITLHSATKLQSADQTAKVVVKLHAAGKKVVFTNGCFDILHLGHVIYLEASRLLGDALIVGINSDDSVRRLKGPDRPVNSEGDRARVIAALSCVDVVVVFCEDTPLQLIKIIKPDVLCKGADYKRKEDIAGWDFVEGLGGKIVLIPIVEGRSTSKTIQKLLKK